MMRRNVALLAMIVACTAVFLTAMDQMVVVTALPRVIRDLQISPTHLDRAAWIVSAYLLGYIVVMPLMGRVSDIYGRRRVFVICLGIFALGSLFCGLAPILGNNYDISVLQNFGIDVSSPGLVWLVAARFIQAIGGGAVVPVTMAVASDLYGPARRAVILGLIGMVTETGGVLGPLYGTLIVQTWGWQYIFYLNLPIVAILIILIMLFIPAKQSLTQPAIETRDKRKRESIDIPGAILLGGSLLCLSLGLAQQAAQITPQTVGITTVQNNPWFIAAAVILFVAFIALEFYLERRKRAPIIELSLFKRLPFTAASLVSLLVGAALIIAIVDIPIFFITILNRPDIESGLALLRLTAMIPVGALIGGWLCGRITCRWTAVIGLLLTIVGFWLMYRWPIDVDWTQITISTLITGLGLGLVIAPISTTALNAVNNQQLGVAASLVTVLRMVGMILGLAGLTSWGLGRFTAQAAAFKAPAGIVPPGPKYYALYAHYLVVAAHDIYTAIFLSASVLCFIALIPALFLEGKKPAAYIIRSTDKDTSDVEKYSEQKSEASTIHGQREK